MSDEYKYSKKDIVPAVEAFLKKKVKARRNGTAWPDVSREDRDELEKIIYSLIEAKWQRDCDGDQVLRFKTWDRKKESQHNYQMWNIPREPSPEGLQDWLRSLAIHAEIAVKALTLEIECLRYKDVDMKIRSADCSLCWRNELPMEELTYTDGRYRCLDCTGGSK